MKFLYWLYLFCLLSSCGSKQELAPLFELRTADQTGIHFTNQLTSTKEFNMFKYMYFFNGAGVGAGDFNKDGKTDLFFAANQQQSRLFLNKGGLKFEDVTGKAKIPNDSAWSTGVSVADVNADGLLDIYICRVGKFEVLKGKNQLLICKGIDANGIPFFEDEAAAYGLDFSGFSTQAAFFDYDADGDLDMFLMNHSVHQNGTFAPRKQFDGTFSEVSGDRMYRNDKNRFIDVTKASGINSTAIGYGLGICVADINLDGAPDIYIGNDFHENDYLYINQRNGTFKETLRDCMQHTSQFSMGVDVADVTNDGFPEIISMDMLPDDPYVLKRSLGEDEYNTFYYKIGQGYNYQYTRNNLQLNRRDGRFTETGLYSGVSATDWSWSALWLDFDNDGWKDLFISNGIPKRLNDMDYAAYMSNDAVQKQVDSATQYEKDMAVISNFPEIKLPNKFYRNTGNVQFKDMSVKGDLPTFSNGAAYADLDNDGDLDIVVNNIDDKAMLYENLVAKTDSNRCLSLQLKGDSLNPFAIGAKLVVFSANELKLTEHFPVHGFLSSMQGHWLIGLGKTAIDSMVLVWPDNSCQNLSIQKFDSLYSIQYKKGLTKFNYTVVTQRLLNKTAAFESLNQAYKLSLVHDENPFNEFDREPLIPKMVSREGPALAVADINGDGLDDCFLGSSKGNKSKILLQQTNQEFQTLVCPALDADSVWEDVDAVWVDLNNDRLLDLVVASGGNEYYGEDEHMQNRVYMNDGQMHFEKATRALPPIFMTAGAVATADFNGDGFADLFFGGRAVPWEYGQTPKSYLVQNDGKGNFKDVTAVFAKELSNIGMVTGAEWVDLDNDKDADLLLSLEWGSVTVLLNEKSTFKKITISDQLGWWRFAKPVDVDADGDLDIVAGNLGWNSRLQAKAEEPVRLYYNDFDGNGKKEQVLTYYLHGKELPFANKDEIVKQMPALKKQFLYAADFAKSSLEQIFTKEKLSSSLVSTANYFANTIFINDGKMNFKAMAMPWQAQLTNYNDCVLLDANKDQLPDLLLVGNFYDNNIQMGRYDADNGTLLINKGNGQFEFAPLYGLSLHGAMRRIRPLRLANQQQAWLIAKNADTAMLMKMR
jgi:enediyne biosynthesis protein E4